MLVCFWNKAQKKRKKKNNLFRKHTTILGTSIVLGQVTENAGRPGLVGIKEENLLGFSSQ